MRSAPPSAKIGTMAGRSPEALLEEAAQTPFRGWDLAALGDRIRLLPPAWDFEAIVDEAIADVTAMLDMGTGGGEWLSSLRRRPGLTVATESYAPNVPVAAARLRPLGIIVVRDEGAADNVAQHEDAWGRLPFRDATFDVVVNRHETFLAAEVRRVLRPGGAFVTQQASAGAHQFRRLLGLEPRPLVEFRLDRAVEQVEAAGLDVEQAEAGTATTVFADVGALAWYLANVRWAVPEFSIDRFRDTLLRLHGRPIAVASERFWLRARA